MIVNAQQYRVSQKAKQDFDDAIAKAENQRLLAMTLGDDRAAWLLKIQIDGMRSLSDEIGEELLAFERQVDRESTRPEAIGTTHGNPLGVSWGEAPAPGALRPDGQHQSYWILSEAERLKGFIRPVRYSYAHVGSEGPRFPLRELTQEQHRRLGLHGYVGFEEYPSDYKRGLGKYWTQAELDKAGKGCRTVTSMSNSIAETYARNPKQYNLTFCVHCKQHFPVEEFVWEGTDERVGS
jgi:hypothetical protein